MFDEAFVIEYFERLFERLRKEEIKERELKFSLRKGKATAIIGPRRVGKTYLLLKFLKENKNSIYFDMEHAAFKDLNPKDFFEIIPIFEERFKIRVENVLLDEIQRIDKWETLVRSLIDSDYKVLISGSSSKLLSKEIATQLRGRSLSYLLLPLNFREYLYFSNFKFRRRVSLSEKVKIINFLKKYLEWGAYPEVLLEEDRREKILKEYFETILQKDFIERFEVVNVEIAKLIFEFVFQNFSKELSINKIANFISSKMGKSVKNLVYDYVEKLSESFAVFFVEKFEKSVYKRKTSLKKVYICDTGLSNIIRFDKDIGKRMENTVFLELLRKTNEHPLMTIFFWKDYQGREVDFVIKEGAKIKQLIQVTHASARDEIEKREIRDLVKAGEELKCKNLFVVTWDYEGEEKIEEKKVKFIPLWKWLTIY